ERRVVDPVGLAQDLVAESERVKHLDRAHGNAVRLAMCEGAGTSLDHASVDAGEAAQLRGDRKAGRAGPDDEDVDLVGQVSGPRRDPRVGRPKVRVADLVSVGVELHEHYNTPYTE